MTGDELLAEGAKLLLLCRATMTLVKDNKMRPGYDCRCSGCKEYVKPRVAGQ